MIYIKFNLFYWTEEKLPFLTQEILYYYLLFIVSILYVFTLLSVIGEEIKQLFKGNEWLFILFIFLIILIVSSILIFFYKRMKYSKINTNNVYIFVIIAFILYITGLIIATFPFSNFLQILLNITHLISYSLLLISIPPITYIIIRKLEPNPLKGCFSRVRFALSGLLQNSQEPLFHKHLVSILYIGAKYNEGMKEIKTSFGEIIHLNDIYIINSGTKKSIEEILDELTFSIPYYIFHGEKEQLKEMDTHIENINKCIGDIYSIAGGQFVTEILRMNGKINQYFKDNSFDFSKNENRHIRKYSNEFYEKKIFLVLLSLVSSIIISKLGT